MTLFLIILPPLFAALIGYLFRSGKSWPHIAGAAIALAGSVFLFMGIDKHETTTYEFGGLAGQPFLLRADHAMAVLSLVISIVALSIFIYAIGYMKKEHDKSWFWPAISLFLSAMQLMVLSGDWFLFITGWEIMGLASYLLIGTWHEEDTARKGATTAFLMTRFTDLGLYAGAFAVILSFGGIMIPELGTDKISLTAAMLLLLAVMGKSAQVPFQSWLSGAMAGPTPVSALLHSATMVAAGAILLFRVYPLFGEEALYYTSWVGGVTILLTGTTAILSKDIKQMLAASTSSQLGFMLLALGTGHPGAAFAHWIGHAFMKSSLFLGAGVFQHGYDGTSYEKIAGGGKYLKKSFFAFAIAGVGLAGIPPMIGYWSKDAILAASAKSEHFIFFIIALSGALATAIYIGKAIGKLWNPNGVQTSIPHKKWMLAGMGVLLLFILTGGFFLEHLVKSSGYEIPKDLMSKIAGLVLAVAGLITGWIWKDSWDAGRINQFIRNNYSIAGGYEKLIAVPVLKLADFTYALDRGIHRMVFAVGNAALHLSKGAFRLDRLTKNMIELIGQMGLSSSHISEWFDTKVHHKVEALATAIKNSGKYSKKWQSGLVHKELAISVVAILILVFVLTVTLINL